MTNKLISLVIIIFILSFGYSYSDDRFLLPKEKPSIFKKIKKDQGQNLSSNLPQKKPLINEKEESKKPEINQNEDQKKQKIVKEEKELKNVEVAKKKSSFIYPQKKPSIYKSKIVITKKSSILNQKDFDRAKETIQFIKAKNGIVRLKVQQKLKIENLEI